MRLQKQKLLLGLITISLVSLFGCRNCVKPTAKTVINCSIYNGEENHCNMATERDNKKCHFNKASKTCMPVGIVDSFNCQAIELKDACAAQLSCQWNNQFAVCESKPMP